MICRFSSERGCCFEADSTENIKNNKLWYDIENDKKSLMINTKNKTIKLLRNALDLVFDYLICIHFLMDAL